MEPSVLHLYLFRCSALGLRTSDPTALFSGAHLPRGFAESSYPAIVFAVSFSPGCSPCQTFACDKVGCFSGLEWVSFGLCFSVLCEWWCAPLGLGNAESTCPRTGLQETMRPSCSRSCFSCLSNSPLLHDDCAWDAGRSPGILVTLHVPSQVTDYYEPMPFSLSLAWWRAN